jgi:hypothetical protein
MVARRFSGVGGAQVYLCRFYRQRARKISGFSACGTGYPQVFG